MRLRTLILLFAGLAAFAAAGAQNTSRIEAQKKVVADLEKRIAAEEREIARLKQGRTRTEERVKRLARQIDASNQLLEAQEEQALLLAAQLSKTGFTADSLSAALDRNKALYAAMVREAYRNYKHENYLTYLFSAEDFADVARKIANLRAVARMRADRLRQI